MHDRLRALVIDVPDFPEPGIVFRDITALLADAAALREAVDAMAAPFLDTHIDLVAGIESRGFILGAALAVRLDAGFIPVRKQGRLPRSTVSVEYQLEYGSAVLEVHGDAAAQHHRVLIADDVLATGGTAAAAAALVTGLGARLAGFTFLLELSALRGAAVLPDVPVSSVVRYP